MFIININLQKNIQMTHLVIDEVKLEGGVLYG